MNRLSVPEVAWNCAINPWTSSLRETVFQLSRSHEPSAELLGGFFGLQAKAEVMRNKSIFVTLQPKDDIFLMVCPIISVQERDSLGVFAGEIRYASDYNTVLAPKKILGWITPRLLGSLILWEYQLLGVTLVFVSSGSFWMDGVKDRRLSCGGSRLLLFVQFSQDHAAPAGLRLDAESN